MKNDTQTIHHMISKTDTCFEIGDCESYKIFHYTFIYTFLLQICPGVTHLRTFGHIFHSLNKILSKGFKNNFNFNAYIE